MRHGRPNGKAISISGVRDEARVVAISCRHSWRILFYEQQGRPVPIMVTFGKDRAKKVCKIRRIAWKSASRMESSGPSFPHPSSARSPPSRQYFASPIVAVASNFYGHG